MLRSYASLTHSFVVHLHCPLPDGSTIMMQGLPASPYAIGHAIEAKLAAANSGPSPSRAGWGTGADERDFVDVGWGSVWVKLVTQWATVCAYAWLLLAPALLPEREFL